MTTQILQNWKETKFKDFVRLQRGFDLPKQDRKDGTYPVIASTSVTGYHDKYKVEPPCVTTGRSGALGEVLFIKSKCWPLNTALWIKDFKGNDPYFVYSKLKTLHLEQYNSGAGVPTLNRNHLDQIRVDVPPLTDQKQISNILSTYDDLIENNTRRIEIVEQITQAIYTEWFVNFRFPGHEKVKMVDSGTDFGKIPEGWEVKSIGDILTVKYGKNLPKTKITESGEYPVYGAGGVIGFYTEKNVDEKTALITSRGNGSGTVWRTKGAGFVTNNSFTVVGNDEHLYLDMSFIYNSLLNANIRSSISGSAQPQVTINSLNYVQVIVPEKNLVESFQSEIYPLYILVDKLFMVNQNLSLTRDSLLPKLVTGEIRI